MDEEYLITSLTRHKENESRYNEDVHKKQRTINQNNKNIMIYKKRISQTKSVTTIKSYYSKIATLENNNEKLQKDITGLLKKSMSEHKEIRRLENQLMSINDRNINMGEESIEMLNNVINEEEKKLYKTYEDIIKDFYKSIKEHGLRTHYGLVSNIKDSGGNGGNGRVLFGELNKHEVAIKVLYKNETSKINRFFDEFVNVFMTLQKEKGIVELYLYESYEEEGRKIHYIVMKKYQGNLSSKKPEVNKENTIKLFYDLCSIIKKIHKVGIIHRDIKPENILIDENNEIILCDYGIAYFDPEEFENTGHTLYKELLGNRKFSAPEQANKGTEPHETMDIYALGQIIQWFVTGDTHSGTGRKKLDDIINETEISGLDIIIDKCLRANPRERYQTIDEIYSDLERYNIKLGDTTNYNLTEKDNGIKLEKNDLGLGTEIVVV